MITFTGAELNAWVGALLWPFMRIGAMLLAAPVFGARMIPVRIRLVLALILAATLAPSVSGNMSSIEPLSVNGLIVSIQQIVIGLAMGFTIQMVFSALVIAAQSISMGMGLGFAMAADPLNGVQVPVIGQFYLALATLAFLALNGHLIMIQVLIDSFHSLPVGSIGLSQDSLWMLVGWGGRMFAGAVLIALTAMTAMLLVNVAFGVMSRAAPQLNIFGVGFPVMMGAGFIVMLVSLPTLIPHFSDLLLDAFGVMNSLAADRG